MPARGRRERASPTGEAGFRLLAHRLVSDQSPYLEFSARSQGFIETIEGSETLKARARAIRDELAPVVTVALSDEGLRLPGAMLRQRMRTDIQGAPAIRIPVI